MIRRACLGAIVALCLACGGAKEPPKPPAAAPEHAWLFDVTPSDDGGELSVVATFGPGVSTLDVRDDAGPFVRDVEVFQAGAWTAVSGRPWNVPSCATRGCSVRYRFLLHDAAEGLRDPDAATLYDGTVVSPPSMWLLRSWEPPDGTIARVHVACGGRCAIGMARAKGGLPDTYEADASDLFDAGYAAFGPMKKEVLTIGPSHLELVTSEHGTSLGDELLAWTKLSAEAISSYYGKLPDDSTILAFGGARRGSVDGETIGVSVRMVIDNQLKEPGKSAWVLPHELIHVCSPNLQRGFEWIQEGMATYVEPIARARIGEVTAERVWTDLVEGLPQGQPEAGDQGLDETHTWGRTYWGGALFFFVADVNIRERTGGRKSLMDALRAVSSMGAHAAAVWPIEKFLDVADGATGVRVIHELYEAHAHHAVTVDLDAMWVKLGVEKRGAGVAFKEDAPLAAIRRAMTAR